MMNVYDAAHSLAKAIKESEEYKQYHDMKQVVTGNEDLSDILGVAALSVTTIIVLWLPAFVALG